MATPIYYTRVPNWVPVTTIPPTSTSAPRHRDFPPVPPPPYSYPGHTGATVQTNMLAVEAARHPANRQVYRPAEHLAVPSSGARARPDTSAERIAREGRLGSRPDDRGTTHDRRPSSRPVTPTPAPAPAREPSPQPVVARQGLRTRVSFSSLRAQRCDVGPEPCDPRDHQHRSGRRGEDVVEFTGPPLNEPNHRRFHSDHLRPALRTSASRERLHNRRLSEPTRAKPPPPAPFPNPPATASGSLAVPILRGLTPVPGGSGHSYSLPQAHAGFNHLYAQARGLQACPDPAAHRQHQRPQVPPKDVARPNPYSMTANMEIDPADKLYSYLHFATIEYWSSWPAILPYSKARGASGAGGRAQMGREWTKRFKETEKGRAGGRELRSWQAGKPWSADIFGREWNSLRYPLTGQTSRGTSRTFLFPRRGVREATGGQQARSARRSC